MEYSKNQLKELSNTLDTKTYKNLDHSINEEGLNLVAIYKKALMCLFSLVTFKWYKKVNLSGSLNSSPCLVFLNADYQPCSYFPLSLWELARPI